MRTRHSMSQQAKQLFYFQTAEWRHSSRLVTTYSIEEIDDTQCVSQQARGAVHCSIGSSVRLQHDTGQTNKHTRETQTKSLKLFTLPARHTLRQHRHRQWSGLGKYSQATHNLKILFGRILRRRCRWRLTYSSVAVALAKRYKLVNSQENRLVS